MRSMTKSPIAVGLEALAIGQSALPLYSGKHSRRDFTQPQLFAVLVLRIFFKTDLRGIEQLLSEFTDLRNALGLSKAPTYSTLCKAEKRFLQTDTLSSRCLALLSSVLSPAA